MVSDALMAYLQDRKHQATLPEAYQELITDVRYNVEEGSFDMSDHDAVRFLVGAIPVLTPELVVGVLVDYHAWLIRRVNREDR